MWLRASRAPGWEDTRWLAAISGTAALYSFCDFTQVIDASDAATRWFGQLSICLGGLHCAAWFLFLEARDRQPLTRIERIVVATGVGVSAASLFPHVVFTDQIVSFTVPWLGVTWRVPEVAPWGIPLLGIFLGSMVFVAIRALRRWNDGWSMRVPAVGALLLIALGVHDTMATARLFTSPLLLDLGFLAVVSGYGLFELRRLIDGARKLDEIRRSLADQVTARTSELKQALEALARTEKLAAIGQLAGGVAHEINNPASVVLSNLTYALSSVKSWDARPDDLMEALDDASTATQRISSIVKELAAVGHVATLAERRDARCDARVVLEQLVARARRSHPSVELSVRGTAGEVAVDESVLDEVLGRMLKNALSAVEGEPDPRVEVALEADEATLSVSVSDSGPGIKPEHQAHLFEPFFTTRGVGRGTGLGLAVALGLLRANRGELSFAGNAPTRFVARVPLTRPVA
ncbi:MAG: hypothetical protein JNM17_16805 [Archangium sp.]|nr:hypothetical protein [Archangium sp.]